jgi:hypothetical protein
MQYRPTHRNLINEYLLIKDETTDSILNILQAAHYLKKLLHNIFGIGDITHSIQ